MKFILLITLTLQKDFTTHFLHSLFPRKRSLEDDFVDDNAEDGLTAVQKELKKSEEAKMREYYEEIILESEQYLSQKEQENESKYKILTQSIETMKEKWSELSKKLSDAITALPRI